jgi:hypothetical protein
MDYVNREGSWGGDRNAPRNRAHHRGRQRRERPSPTCPKTRPAKSAVPVHHRARGASARTCRRPRSTSCRRIGDNLTDKGTVTKRRRTHAIVAAASFWYPHGHNPRSASVWPPPHTPRSHAAPLSSSARRSKPTCSSVHAGAPDPPA